MTQTEVRNLVKELLSGVGMGTGVRRRDAVGEVAGDGQRSPLVVWVAPSGVARENYTGQRPEFSS